MHTDGDAPYLGGANDVARRGITIVPSPTTGYWIAWAPSGPPAPPNSGGGRRVVYSIPLQHVWTVEANETVSHEWSVSGRRNLPYAGTYRVLSKAVGSYSGNLILPNMTRFTVGPGGHWIGFHGIPLAPGGRPIQSDAQLGTPLSHGCVRMNQQAARHALRMGSARYHGRGAALSAPSATTDPRTRESSSTSPRRRPRQ